MSEASVGQWVSNLTVDIDDDGAVCLVNDASTVVLQVATCWADKDARAIAKYVARLLNRKAHKQNGGRE